MKVLIDLTFLGDGRITGIERFSIETYKRLKNNVNVEYICLVPKNFFQINGLVTNVILPTNNKFIAHFLLTWFALTKTFDKLFVPAFPPNPLIFLLQKVKRFSTYRVLHDVVPWTHGVTTSLKVKWYFRPLEELWLKNYQKLFTVSNYSAEQIKIHLGLQANTVIYNGVSEVFQEKYSEHCIKVPNIISVGTIEPRKNYNFIVDIFEHVKNIHPNATLTICGRRGWGYDALLSYVETKSSFKNKIKILTDLTDKELQHQYQKSNIFVFGSVEEGFGIPLVEAMSNSIPIIAANNSAISEVVGESGILLSNEVSSDWSRAILKLFSDKALYEDYSIRSYERSKKFTWDASVKKLETEFISDQ